MRMHRRGDIRIFRLDLGQVFRWRLVRDFYVG
jgi:hypothetical protein